MYFIFVEVALNLSSTFKERYNNNQVTSDNLFKSDNNFNDKIMNGWIKNKRKEIEITLRVHLRKYLIVILKLIKDIILDGKFY